MGVDRRDYIVYGWKLPYPLKDSNGEKIDFWDEKFLPYIEGRKGEDFTLVVDGMCGDYCVFGQLIARETGYEGWSFVHLNFEKFDAEKVKQKYREVFELSENEPMGDPYLFIFSHFS